MTAYRILVLNLLYHYETSLFGVLAPVLAPIFFPDTSYLTALMLYFAPYRLLAKPVGALYWGAYGDKVCRVRATRAALLGVALSTLLLGLLPSLGIGPQIFIGLRVMRGFFEAGASTGTPLVLLEVCEPAVKNRWSSRYEVAGMAGVFVATALALGLSLLGILESHWRLLFLIGGTFSLCQLAWLNPKAQPKVTYEATPLRPLLPSILAIGLVTGFSCGNYNLVMLLMHSYLPEVAAVTQTQIQMFHLGFILLDIALLPLFGRLAQAISKELLMIAAMVGLLLFLLPMMAIAAPLTLGKIFLARFGMLVFGVALAAPYHHWTQELLPGGQRFRGIAIGKVVGKELLGAPAVSISLFLLQWTGHEAALFGYVAILAGLGALACGHRVFGRDRKSKHIRVLSP